MTILSAVAAVDETPIDRYLEAQADLTAVERFSQRHDAETPPLNVRYYRDLIPLTVPQPGQQYAFDVDLDACTGCKACVAACHSLNGLDDGESWRSVTMLSGGTTIAPFQQTVTSACHHCVDPACLNGCPQVRHVPWSAGRRRGAGVRAGVSERRHQHRGRRRGRGHGRHDRARQPDAGNAALGHHAADHDLPQRARAGPGARRSAFLADRSRGGAHPAGADARPHPAGGRGVPDRSGVAHLRRPQHRELDSRVRRGHSCDGRCRRTGTRCRPGRTPGSISAA